jgi:hypothetical protein
MTFRRLGWWALGALLVLSFDAAAQTPPATALEAKKHFTRSRELYEEGDLTGALKELERSYALVPNYKLLFNLGQIQAQTQDYAAALKSFRKFLVDGGDEVPEARRADVLREVDRLRTRVAELTVLVNLPGAEVTVDDVPLGVSPLPGPVTVNVGKRRVTASLPNHFPVTKLVDVAGLDLVNVRLELAPIAAPAPAAEAKLQPGPAVSVVAPEPASKPARFPVWLPWVGTAALGIGAGVMSGLAWQASGVQRTLLGTYGTTRGALDAAAQRTRTFALVADGLWAGTAVAGVGALLFTLLRSPDAAPEPQNTLTVVPGPGSVTMVTTW